VIKKYSYIVFYKPFDVLTQFTKERPEHKTLADYIQADKDIYPVGRLDKDSEGLLLLTNDKRMNEAILSPDKKLKKTYMVQIENQIQEKELEMLRTGVDIQVDQKTYRTQPCNVKLLAKPPALPERIPPVRFRKSIPTSWILMTISEGKNRQIRKMCAKVGFPVLRLVRVQMANLTLGKLLPGQHVNIEQEQLVSMLGIDLSKKRAEPIATLKIIKAGAKRTSQNNKKSQKPKNVRNK
jgi:23S rRNA pseudouridine2457 synthase